MHEAHGHGACQLRLAKDRVDSSPLSVDRKSTRLNSSHGYISYAVFCLKKKNLRRTLRGSLRGGGAMIDLARLVRRRRHPPLVVLFDISGSLIRDSRMLLLFTHTITNAR